MPSVRVRQVFWTFTLAFSLFAGAAAASAQPPQRNDVQWPLQFERNDGQFPEDWAYAARGAQAMLAMRGNDILLTLRPASGNQDEDGSSLAAARQFNLRFIGGRSDAPVVGEQPAKTKVNYYLGDDPAAWRTGVPTFASVRAREVYPGIDVVVYGNPREAEFDWIVAPGADPGLIQWTVADMLDQSFPPTLTPDGDLVWQSPAGVFRQRQPVAWQMFGDEKRPVEARFVLDANYTARLALGDYDPSHTLIIDPILIYSTYFGGTQSDTADAIAVDFEGNIYFAGQTFSPDLPTNPANDDTFFGNVFVAKMNPDGDTLEFITVFGGSSFEFVHDMVVTANSVYVGGSTNSSNFPTLNGFQETSRGNGEGFVFHVSTAEFTLQNSTYFGSGTPEPGESSATDNVLSIDADGELNRVFICGTTTGSDMWEVNSLQGNQAGSDGYVAVLGGGGATLLFSTYLGGAQIDQARGIKFNEFNGAIYVAGTTGSGAAPGQFPIVNATQPTYGGGTFDVFVTIIDFTDTPQFLFSTFLGGSNSDSANDIAFTSFDEALVVGETDSSNFPRVNPQFPLPPSPGRNAFYTIIDPFAEPSPLIFQSTTLGGGGADEALRVDVGFDRDETESYYVLGLTNSADFPLVNPYQRVIGNPGQNLNDATLIRLARDGEIVAYSTYLGGENADFPKGLAVSEVGDVFISGWTTSLNFPTVFPFQADKLAPQTTTSDAFISVFEDPPNVAAFAPPRLTHAILADANFNNVGEEGETLILQFDRAVEFDPVQLEPASFYLPVAGDSLGTTISIQANEFNARQLLVTLGTGASLNILGEVNPFDPQNPASGIDLDAFISPTTITSVAGVPAINSGDPQLNDSAIDLKVVFFPVTVNVGAPSPQPIIVAPAPSSDAALTRTMLVLPPDSISNASVTLRPSNIDPRVPYAVEIEVSIDLFTTVNPMTLYVEYLESEVDRDNGFVERGMRLFQYTPIGPDEFLWLESGVNSQQVNIHRNTVIIELFEVSPFIPVGAAATSNEGPASSVGIFGNIPGETIESASLFIKPSGSAGAAAKAALVPSPFIQPGSGGHYFFHEVEFPGYEETTPEDPVGINVVMRKPNLFDLAVLNDSDQGFPLDSSALFVVETTDFNGDPYPFTDPVNITVEFRDGSDGNYNDIFTFNNTPGDASTMALVYDAMSGFGVHFVYDSNAGSVSTFAGGGTVEALGVPFLTNFEGEGIWGAVSTGLTPAMPDTWILF